LGLSTCYGIIRQHDGDITCGNRLEGGAYHDLLPAAALEARTPESTQRLFLSGQDEYSTRHKVFLGIAGAIFLLHIGVAAFVKPSCPLTMFGDALPCGLLIVAILAVRENFRFHGAVLPLFWKLMAAGLFQMLLSQSYWFYYDSLRRYSAPSPVIGDTLFLLAHVFFLSAFVLRPHSASAGSDMRLRHQDFALLTFWWLALYGYFALPWQIVIQDFAKYNPTYYLIALIQHLMILTGLAVVWKRSAGGGARFTAVHRPVCTDCCGEFAAEWPSIAALIIPAAFTTHPSWFPS
jgi:hypothetical protein